MRVTINDEMMTWRSERGEGDHGINLAEILLYPHTRTVSSSCRSVSRRWSISASPSHSTRSRGSRVKTTLSASTSRQPYFCSNFQYACAFFQCLALHRLSVCV